MNAVEMQVGDPFVVLYLKIFNTNAPTKELQAEREELRLQFGQLRIACEEHFHQTDEVRTSQLLLERDAVTEQAKAILAEINELQRAAGFRSASQSSLQSDLETATRKLQDFTPVNRTIASLSEIEADEISQDKLRRTVNQAKQAIVANQRTIVETGEYLRSLKRQYREVQVREESISKAIEDLKLAPEQRGKRSSIVWQAGDSVFALKR